MPLSLRVIPGYQFGDDERLTQVKLNQLGRPTIELQGALASSAIAPGSITSDKLSPALITGLSDGDPDKGDLVMFHDFFSNGLRKTTIDKILALSTPSLTQITTVALTDMAWIIQAGNNYKATISDTLRDAINGQTELLTPDEIDKANDTLLLWDASAPAGSDRNRKAKVGVTVKTVTNTLIADAPAFNGTLDRGNDELLLRDASLTAGTQQVRVKLQDLLAQAGGIKAWARINANLSRTFVDCTWVATQDILTTATPHNLAAGDFIWFNDTYNQAPQVAAFTAYYVFPINSTTFQLYSTRAAALAQSPAQRIDIPVDTSAKKYTRWSTNPIVAGSNISAVITTRSTPGDIGYYRVFFELPLLSSLYAIQITASYYEGDHDQQGLGASVNIAGSNASPSATSNPTSALFDLLVRNISGNDPAAPDILSVTVFQ
jgi:hypothetical protein